MFLNLKEDLFLPWGISAWTASSSRLAASPVPSEAPLLSSVLSSLAFSASFSDLFFSLSGLTSFLTGRMLPGEGGRAWAEETLEEPGGEFICLGVPGKKGKDFDACLCNQRAIITITHALLDTTYTSLLQLQWLKIEQHLYFFAIKQDSWRISLLSCKMLLFAILHMCEHQAQPGGKKPVSSSSFLFLRAVVISFLKAELFPLLQRENIYITK